MLTHYCLKLLLRSAIFFKPELRVRSIHGSISYCVKTITNNKQVVEVFRIVIVKRNFNTTQIKNGIIKVIGRLNKLLAVITKLGICSR